MGRPELIHLFMPPVSVHLDGGRGPSVNNANVGRQACAGCTKCGVWRHARKRRWVTVFRSAVSPPAPSEPSNAAEEASTGNPRPTDAINVRPNAISCGIGLSAGVVGSLIGAGGGIIVTPMLTNFLDLRQHDAHGTALIAVAVSSLMGCLAYARGNCVSPLIAAVLCAAALITARLGAVASHNADGRKLRAYFGSFLLFLAVFIQIQPWLRAVVRSGGALASRSHPDAAPSVKFANGQIPLLLVAGAVTGYISGLLGIGGGTLMVPALSLGVGLPQKTAQGTALAAMVLPSVLGSYTYARRKCVKRSVLPGLLVGVTAGALLGGNCALGLDERFLRALCGVVFVFTGLKLVGFGVPWRRAAGGRAARTEAASTTSSKRTLYGRDDRFDCAVSPTSHRYVWDNLVLDSYDQDDEIGEYLGSGI